MPATQRTRTFSVLFVDDEPDNLLVLRTTFSRRFDVLTATDGASVLALLAVHPVAAMRTPALLPAWPPPAGSPPVMPLRKHRWPAQTARAPRRRVRLAPRSRG